MIVGFDFDNTIINYQKLFKKIAYKKRLVPKNINPNKESVKKYLISKNKNEEWTALQGEVYGKYIMDAKIYTGVKEIMETLSKKKIKFYIISHKTKFPYLGKKINLHFAAKKWIHKNIMLNKNLTNFSMKEVFFESSIENKISRIKKLKCSIFVDDLVSILDLLPKGTVKVLFNQNQKIYREKNFFTIQKWIQLKNFFIK